MKKHTSIKYLLLHLFCFCFGLFTLLSAWNIVEFLDQYDSSNHSYIETSYFHEHYMKYIERLTLFIRYSEDGYTSDQSELSDIEKIDYLENNTANIITNMSNDEIQADYEFYNYCLMKQSTNFLFYVKNTTTGRIFYSPYLDLLYPNDASEFTKSIETNRAYFVLNTKSGKYTTNVNQRYNILNKSDLSWMNQVLSQPVYNKEKEALETYSYIVYTGILSDFSNMDDIFHQEYMDFTSKYSNYKLCIYLLPTCIILFIISLLGLIYFTGHHKVNVDETSLTNGIYLNSFDHIYSELACAMIIAVIFLLLAILYSWIRYIDYISSGLLILSLIYVLIYPFSICGLLSLIRRIKARTLCKNTLLYNLGKSFKKKACDFFTHHNITYRIATTLCIFLLIQTLGFVTYFIGHNFLLMVLLVVISYFYLIGYFIRFAIDLGMIMDGAREIQDGNVNRKLPSDSLNSALVPLSEHINNISSGLWVAVEERTKSERFKAELITNVSHDIKTPLTSIINYVDLLKKEPLESEKAKEYLEVLTSKSWRLKTLIEDLVEASKASSGAIKMNPQKLNLVELVQQVTGEFDDRFKSNQLELVITAPDYNVTIFADGRSTYRVIDNILSNVNKYAMKGTRVYIDVYTENKFATLTVKNISSTRLNISAEELMERFIRGDSSRNTEGSGLGLSISRSLTTLQNGSFDIEVDGDLFKVIVRLPMDTEPLVQDSTLFK